jgi:uncharacterized repeat protein (TIGR03803 family)
VIKQIVCATLVLCTWLALVHPASAQTITTLYSFCTQVGCPDGAEPLAALIQATDGNFYGTTLSTVFRITPSGSLTTLYTFCDSQPCPNGSGSVAGLVQVVADGDLYGAAYRGGANSGGTIFKITLDGTLTTVYNFCSIGTFPDDCEDGAGPNGLMQAVNGELYGTTNPLPPTSVFYQGASGYGTVFKIASGGVLTTLHTFCPQGTGYDPTDCPDGAYPQAPLIQATNGDFYGTTYFGGAYGYGTVFKITSRGVLTTLYSFCSLNDCPDGAGPAAGLTQATDGDLYGTTAYGGADGGGTVFKITPSGTLTTLYAFCVAQYDAGCTDGGSPLAPLIQGSDGNLYGTTGGTAFQLSLVPGNKLTTYPFGSSIDSPNFSLAGLFQGTDGNFYGTTQYGGTGINNVGTVFSLATGLAPFVETQTLSGKIGNHVKILGTDLTGATSVTFNGTPATFTVNFTGSAIRATIPTGATTGTVTVTTPSRVLSSNRPFTVQE